ncbi:hypothetical protein [Agriterribacter sp.]|uniref:hypothetical protein n=1 Tax=Agriterribacter sp. TaxID=2821509 RepID=UPI002D1FB26A|nr:hypothetical protein [Agriterribacter sp.]
MPKAQHVKQYGRRHWPKHGALTLEKLALGADGLVAGLVCAFLQKPLNCTAW